MSCRETARQPAPAYGDPYRVTLGAYNQPVAAYPDLLEVQWGVATLSVATHKPQAPARGAATPRWRLGLVFEAHGNLGAPVQWKDRSGTTAQVRAPRVFANARVLVRPRFSRVGVRTRRPSWFSSPQIAKHEDPS